MRRPFADFSNGSVVVQLTLGPEVIAFAQARWRQLGYLDAGDYLTGVLNTAMRAEMEAPTGAAFADFDENDDLPLPPGA